MHMKIKYNKQDDVMMVELNKKPIDYAEQSGDLIVHFSPNNEAVLLEILNASNFLTSASKALPQNIRKQVFA